MNPLRHATLAAALAATLLGTGCGYRDLGQAKTESAAAWGLIAQIYTARTHGAHKAIEAASHETGFDPQLVETARGALARAVAMPAQPELLQNERDIDTFKRNQGELTGALFRLVVTAQSFPALREDESIKTLRAQLMQAETQLSAARARYSRSAAAYNALTHTFPSAVTARLLGYGAMPTTL